MYKMHVYTYIHRYINTSAGMRIYIYICIYIYACVCVCVCVCCTVRRPSCYFSLIANTGFNSRFDSRSTRVVMSSMVVVARERHTMTYLLIHEIEILRTWIQRSDSRLFPSSPVVIRTCTHVYRRTHADEHGFRRARGAKHFAMCQPCAPTSALLLRPLACTCHSSLTVHSICIPSRVCTTFLFLPFPSLAPLIHTDTHSCH